MDIEFARSQDAALIAQILRHPKLYPLLVDDFAPTADEFEPVMDPRVWHVLARKNPGRRIAGLFSFYPQNEICWEGHVALLPWAWGMRAIGPAAMRWVFEHTRCRRILAQIPIGNAAAVRFAERCGLERIGIDRKSFQKNGVLVDRVLLGLSPDEELPTLCLHS